jgi:hypothetical protein
MACPEAAPLRDEPAMVIRTPVDLQPVEEVPDEQRGERSQPVRAERLDAHLSRAVDLDDIDEAVGQIERDCVAGGLDPAASWLVNEAPDLAEAPAQLAPRVVRDVPQKLAEATPGNGTRSERQIGEERAHLARRRERQRDPVPADRQGAEHAHVHAGTNAIAWIRCLSAVRSDRTVSSPLRDQ